MKYHTVVQREGEDVGPIDWDHPLAKDKPRIWRDAEKHPENYVFSEYKRKILRICMYDGWSYWKPMPAILFIGPMNSAEWAHFNSYGVHGNSIVPVSPAHHHPTENKGPNAI
jgi:hypothetical protein